MAQRYIKLTLSLLLVSLLTIFIGCADEGNFPGNELGHEPEVIISNTISIPMEKIRTLNPILSVDEDTYYLDGLIYRGLFVLNGRLEAQGALADSYSYDDKGNLLIQLAQGVKWHDGEEFTANDVKFSVDAYKSAPSNRRGVYFDAISMIRSVKVLDSYNIQIQFADANNAAVENLTFPILPSHIYKRPSDAAKVEEGFKPLGTGPYQVSDIEEGKQIVLTGNPHYKGAVPENILRLTYIPKKMDALNLFSINEINMTYLKNIDRDTLIENKEVEIVSFPANEAEVVGFNFNHGALQDPNVRKAIAHAIDNKIILETCYFNSGIMNNNIYYPGYMGLDSSVDPYDYNPAEAAKLLKASGYEGLSLNLIFNGENHSRNLAAQVMKSGMEKVGIAVNLVSLTEGDYVSRLAKGDFDLYIGGFRFNENYDLRPLLHTKGDLNHIRYSNPRMDDLLVKMQQGISRQEKKDTFETLHRLYLKEIPYYCLLYRTYGLAVSEGLEGQINPYFHNIYNGCETWMVTYEKAGAEN